MPPQDPRIVTVPGMGLPGPLQGTTTLSPAEQAQRITVLLSDLYRASLPTSDPMYLSMPPTVLDQHITSLEAWAFYTPDLLTSIRDTLGEQFGFDPGSTTGVDGAVATAFNQILSTAERSSTTTTQTTTTAQGITRTGQETRDRTIGRRVTRYVDLPTPEEFLDDFEVGLATYVQGLRREKLITSDAADWLAQNEDFMLDRYLADLGARAARGEQIFRVVGATGTPIRIGERAGEASLEETSGIDRSQIHERIVTEQRDIIEEEVRSTMISTGTQATSEQEQQVQQEVDRRINEETNRLISEAIQIFGTERILTVEEIFSRPRLATVFTVSPLSFLQTSYDAHSLENLAAGRKGTRQMQAETAAGVAPSAPRRVGGV